MKFEFNLSSRRHNFFICRKYVFSLDETPHRDHVFETLKEGSQRHGYCGEFH